MSTQIEVKEPIKLLNKDGSLTQPGWAKRNIIESTAKTSERRNGR